MRPVLRLASYGLTKGLRVRLGLTIESQVRSIATHTYNHHASALSILPTNVDKSSEEYKNNASQMGGVITRMEELHRKIEGGGPAKARDKHIARGKMLPREYVAGSCAVQADVMGL